MDEGKVHLEVEYSQIAEIEKSAEGFYPGYSAGRSEFCLIAAHCPGDT